MKEHEARQPQEGLPAEPKPELTLEDRLAVALGEGHRLLRAGHPSEAADRLEQALALARQLGDDREEAAAGGLLAQAYLRLGLREEALREAEAALHIARTRQDEEAVRHFEQIRQAAQTSPQELELNAAFGDGRAALVDGQGERAVEKLEHALQLAENLKHDVALCATCQLLAQAYHLVGRDDDALRLAERAQTTAAASGDRAAAQRAQELQEQIKGGAQTVVVGLAQELEWGQTALAQGELERGVRHLERAKSLAQEQGQGIPEASASGLLAQAYLELGRQEEAQQQAREALAIAEQLGHEEAAEDFRALLAATQANPQHQSLAREIHLGAAALEAGHTEEGREHLERALLLAEELSNEVAEALVCGLLAQAELQLGRLADAARHARRGLEVARDRGETASVEHFRNLLAKIEKTS